MAAGSVSVICNHPMKLEAGLLDFNRLAYAAVNQVISIPNWSVRTVTQFNNQATVVLHSSSCFNPDDHTCEPIVSSTLNWVV